ncbi:undecaprenyl-diphosphate phosphatase [Aestuariivirga litoralis]|uniref:undecaprenyl-diphosphate phosphatase n=1 Tax=Aestuariivirga litoralis TaxID=2650924 RepID=UPI0018C76E0B|nr:undecaprenyl-diphosphate phosphatase [Aestuariivirga litoralis]MBG1232940.1 undecaprenyl-diphosphate phosphatase [Aestuariivirga litoralis]
MMSLLQIVVLALIQGITEYLPISSTGHLILVPAFTGWPDQGFVTDMVTNLGTVTATIVYFWRDVVSMLQGLVDIVKRRSSHSARLVTNVIVATIPIIIFGLVIKKLGLVDHLRSPLIVAINSIVFGLLLYVADSYGKQRNTIRDLNWKNSLIIGLFQCLALNPGTSRSGITMTGGRFLGFMRSDAARFSFLISIPANLAASAKVLGDAVQAGESISFDQIICGVLTFFIGLGTIHFLMNYIRNRSLLPFVIYRVILGSAILGLIYSGMPLGVVK